MQCQCVAAVITDSADWLCQFPPVVPPSSLLPPHSSLNARGWCDCSVAELSHSQEDVISHCLHCYLVTWALGGAQLIMMINKYPDWDRGGGDSTCKRSSSWAGCIQSERVRPVNRYRENIIVRMSGKVRETWGESCGGLYSGVSTLPSVFRDNYWSIVTVHTTHYQCQSRPHFSQLFTLTSLLRNIHIQKLNEGLGLILLMRRLIEYMNISINLFDDKKIDRGHPKFFMDCTH